MLSSSSTTSSGVSTRGFPAVSMGSEHALIMATSDTQKYAATQVAREWEVRALALKVGPQPTARTGEWASPRYAEEPLGAHRGEDAANTAGCAAVAQP